MQNFPFRKPIYIYTSAWNPSISAKKISHNNPEKNVDFEHLEEVLVITDMKWEMEDA